MFIRFTDVGGNELLLNYEDVTSIRKTVNGTSLIEIWNGSYQERFETEQTLEDIERQLSVEKRARARYKRERTRFVTWAKEKYKAVKSKISEATADKPEE